MRVVKPAGQRIVDLLVGSGVKLETWRYPAELAEPHEGEPIDYDDLLEFHELIRDADVMQLIEEVLAEQGEAEH